MSKAKPAGKIMKAVKKLVPLTRSITIPGLAATAVGLVAEGLQKSKAKSIKEGGISNKKTRAQLKKNKRIVSNRKKSGPAPTPRTKK